MNPNIDSQVFKILDILVRSRYEKSEFNTVAVKYPSKTIRELMSKKFEIPTFHAWEKLQNAFQQKIGKDYKIKPATFPVKKDYFLPDPFYGLKLSPIKSEASINGLYFYKSMNSSVFVNYSISENRKIGYPNELELEIVSIFKELFIDIVGIDQLGFEFPHKYWSTQPQSPYYYFEYDPEEKLNYFDLFFGGPKIFGGPFYRDYFLPINDYGIQVEKTFLSDLGAIIAILPDPLAPD